MISLPQKQQLGQLLDNAAVILDIPPDLYEKAVKKYEEVGGWLGDVDSALQPAQPVIYPQGSFRLGTIIRPLTDSDEYDVDLVCLLHLKKQSVSQEDLKSRIGRRLKQKGEYREVLTEGRRCWTLDYDGQFHMDILPAIPDEQGIDHSILITDKELVRWQHSDPKNYSAWFWDRMRTAVIREKRALAEELKAQVEDVPDWKVRTPLQRAVQLLKRHRDLYFQDDQDDKPASIILTTLAAKAYLGQDDVLETLSYLARMMPNFIEIREGVHWVENPVNRHENFADKWKDHPTRRDKFFTWLGQVEADLSETFEKRGLHQITESLGRSFGNTVMTKAAAALGRDALAQRQAGKLFMTPGVGTLGSAGSISVRSHNFYGGLDEDETH